MNELKTIIAFLLFFTIYGCEKDLPIQTGADELYTLSLYSTRNNREVTLKWENPICEYCKDSYYTLLEPQYFEILMSTVDPSELEPYEDLSNNIFGATIGNLVNGKPYYFSVIAVGRNGKYVISNTIMTIPDDPENIQPLFQTIDENSELGTWSPDGSSVAYMGDYTWDNGYYSDKSVFISILSTNEKWLIEKSSYSPEWSPTGQKITYHTDNGEVNTSQGYRPTHIAVYNTQDSTIKRLTSGNSFNFRPTWSPDGNWIAFLSDQAGGNEYNIWKIPADSGTVIQVTTDFNDLTDFLNMTERSPQKPSWSKDKEYIAFARLKRTSKGYDFDIYSVPSTGGNKTTVIYSQWDDYCPAYSPDGSTIAFISNRSGLNEIWTMDLQTKKLKQITGSSKQWINGDWGKIEWSPSGDKILFTSYFDQFFTLFTVDIN